MPPELITRNDSTLAVGFTREAFAIREAALESAALIGKVTTGAENKTAVEVQANVKSILSMVEKARKETKEPVLEFGRQIDATARAFVAELEEEFKRISALVGDFAQLELAKARAAESARKAELTDLERQRAAARAEATSHEALDAIDEHFNRLQAESPSYVPQRAENQRIMHDWQVQVTDIWLLAKAHPSCVRITPLPGEIKSLLNAGVKVAGISAERIVRATVRPVRAQNAIEA